MENILSGGGDNTAKLWTQMYTYQHSKDINAQFIASFSQITNQ
jgi:hypothetical protein